MAFKNLIRSVCIVCFSTGPLFAQAVEKFSTSFSFPLTLTSAYGAKTVSRSASFFRTNGVLAHKKIVNLEWSAPQSATKGNISVYSVSGALVKKIQITKSKGATLCDLSRTGAGVYLFAISYGSYSHNLKLALYK